MSSASTVIQGGAECAGVTYGLQNPDFAASRHLNSRWIPKGDFRPPRDHMRANRSMTALTRELF